MRARHQRVTFVIADDHPIFRDGLRHLLESQRGFQVVGEAADGAEAVQLAKKLRPHVVLLDLGMPRYSGLQALRDFANLPLPVRVIVLAADTENSQIMQALQLGVPSVVLKQWNREVLLKSIRNVISGKCWLGDEIAEGVLEIIQSFRNCSGEEVCRKNYGLTPREMEIVGVVADAYANRDIAEKFSISVSTVKNHLSNIFNKLGVSTRLELALFAVNHRLLESGSLGAGCTETSTSAVNCPTLIQSDGAERRSGPA